ncbi:MAG TPA: hypothetical protein VMR80_12965, partial [Candidatus Acidoferrum sp.]|nr:hypothetical protein [Candidatus Acidoferrum sp.]
YYHDLSYSPPHPACANSWGTYHLFMADEHYEIRQPTSQFFATQLITQEWAQPKDAEHRLYLASSDLKDSQGHTVVTAYALHRPDGQWSIMLINKDHDHPHEVRVEFHDEESKCISSFAGPLAMITFGKQQYQWHPARKSGHADPDGPPVNSKITAQPAMRYNLPAASLTILRGRLQ